LSEYEDDLVTSHSEENPELGGTGCPLITDNEDTAASDLYKNKERRLGVRPTENVVEYTEYSPYNPDD